MTLAFPNSVTLPSEIGAVLEPDLIQFGAKTGYDARDLSVLHKTILIAGPVITARTPPLEQLMSKQVDDRRHQRRMPLDPKKLEKPLIKLRKLVRRMSKVPTQDEVHDIRTNTRRVEAALEALHLGQKPRGRRVLRVIAPMRKKAGNVRDMDVLTGFSATLSSNGENQCLVKLLEYLGEERARNARMLRKTVAKRRKRASKRLKSCALFIDDNFVKHSTSKQRKWPEDATAAALHMSRELTSWPRLSANNLHLFRLKVKELRYVLQLSGEDNELTERLGDVKDQIGEWHDWMELDAIAKEVLSDCRNCKVITRIEQTAKQKFEVALEAAQQLRSKYFESQGGHQKQSRKKIAFKEPVLKVAAELAA